MKGRTKKMFWWIFTGVFWAACLAFALLRIFWVWDFGGTLGAATFGTIAIMLTLIFALVPMGCRGEMADFIGKKAMYENFNYHDNAVELSDLNLTQMKIEKNEWLYRAQFMKKEYPFFSFQPDEVLELEPID